MWSENWGEMIWSSAGAMVPTLGPSGFLVLALCLLLAGALLRRRAGSHLLAILGVAALISAPLVALAAVTVPNTFTNGTVADADEVNENFTALATAIDGVSVPVGGVVAWLGSLPGTPALTANFLPCNGQTVSDAESPLDGQTLPDLNGENRFLRGAGSSGATAGQDSVTLTVNEMPSHNHTNGAYQRLLQSNNLGTVQSTDISFGEPNLLTSQPMLAAGGSQPHENRPSFYEVIWIVRIK